MRKNIFTICLIKIKTPVFTGDSHKFGGPQHYNYELKLTFAFHKIYDIGVFDTISFLN